MITKYVIAWKKSEHEIKFLGSGFSMFYSYDVDLAIKYDYKAQAQIVISTLASQDNTEVMEFEEAKSLSVLNF